MVDDQDMDREAERAQQDIKVAAGDGKVLGDAQAVQSRHRQHHAEPNGPGRFLFQENAQDGHNDDVKRGDKSGLAAGGSLQSLLLEVGGYGQGHTAAGTAYGKVLPGLGRALYDPLLYLPAHQTEDQEKQKCND